MGNFNRNKKSGRSQMHGAVCDECGRNCEVPFKPSGDKPIYCDECFQGKGGGGKKSDKHDFAGKEYKKHSMHSAVCDSCGQNCEVPFKPTAGKPIYCDNCFSEKGGRKDRGKDKEWGRSMEKHNEQLKKLNEKLDVILSMLALQEIKEEKKTDKVVAEKKPKKVKKTTTIKPAAKKTTKKKTAAKKTTKKKSTKKKTKTKKK
jgi:CxxC-x17-CxxC domain-containing protein